MHIHLTSFYEVSLPLPRLRLNLYFVLEQCKMYVISSSIQHRGHECAHPVDTASGIAHSVPHGPTLIGQAPDGKI